MKSVRQALSQACTALVVLCGLPTAALGGDGVAEINQTAALAGGVTPADTPGFPVTLSQPGSYVLTSNLVVSTEVIGIDVTADNVSIDLNGFSLIGPTTCTGQGRWWG